jgi:signal transduction histidine kinase
MTGRRAAAGSILVAAWASALSAVLLGLLSGEDWSSVLRLVITAVVYAPVAAIMLGHGLLPLGVLIGALASTSGLLSLSVMLAVLPGAGPTAGTVVQIVAFLARQPEIAALGILPWLLTGAHPIRRWGIALGLAAIGIDIAVSLAAVWGAAPARWIQVTPLVAALASLVFACASLAQQWRRGDRREREALVCFAGGAALLVSSYVRVVVHLPEAGASLADAVFILAQVLLTTAILAVALSGREKPRDDRLFAGVVLVQSLAVGIALYLVVEQSAVLAGLPPQVAGALGAGILALTFSSMTGFIRRRTRTLYFGAIVDAREALARLGDRIDDSSASSGGGVRALAESLLDTWGLASVRITPASDMPGVLVGDPDVAVAVVELRTGSRSVAALEVSSADESILRARVLPVIDEIAPLVGVAVLLASVNNELAETRRRTLGVRREERRMLRRELLDGLAPALAGVGFGLAAAGHRLAEGKPIGEEIGRLRSDVSSSAADVRRLARALLPTALDAGDLDAALDELARRLGTEGIAVSVRSVGADVLDAELQTSIYLATSEALSRLARLAGVRRIDASLSLGEDRLQILVDLPDADLAHDEGVTAGEIMVRLAADLGGALEKDAVGPGVKVVIRR